MLKNIIKVAGDGMDIWSKSEEKMQRDLTLMTFGHYLSHVPKDVSFLDVGCNGGWLLNELKNSGYMNGQGISISKDDVKKCTERNVKVTLMDMNRITFPDNAFDVVWARHSLEHSITPLVALNHFKRIVKKEGLIVLVLPAYNEISLNARSHVFVLNEKQWEKLFRLLNLRLISFLHQQNYGQGYEEYWYLLGKEKIDSGE